jgi:restriction system protein
MGDKYETQYPHGFRFSSHPTDNCTSVLNRESISLLVTLIPYKISKRKSIKFKKKDMPVPNFQSLMLPVLKTAAQGEVKFSAVISLLAKSLGLSQEDISELVPSGKQTVLANRVGWAKTYLKKANLIEYTKRGYFSITQLGKDVLESNPSEINSAYLMEFEDFRQFKKVTEDEESSIILTNDVTQTPHELIASAHKQIQSALIQDLLDRILAAPPDFFERLIINLLMSMGYGGSVQNSGRALGKSGDDGIDGVIDQDALGLDRVYIQAKRYSPGNSIGSGAIRDFFGSLDRHKANKGLFVTTSSFSSSAKETIEFLSKRIVLIDGNQLAKLMISFNVGCRIEQTLYIKKIDEEFFE